MCLSNHMDTLSFAVHVSNESYLAENLEKLGSNALNREQESDIGKSLVPVDKV